MQKELGKLFGEALDYGLIYRSVKNREAVGYIREQILCEFMSADNLYRIKNIKGERLDDIADMLPEGDILFNATSMKREADIHKHIGDYTLFMLGMFPQFVKRKKGKEFLLGRIIVSSINLADQYMLQGRRSYGIAAKLQEEEIFAELAKNFNLYLNLLELARIFLESQRNNRWLRVRDIIIGGN